MAVDAQLIAPSPLDLLLSKLDEPRVVAALNDLLEHADLLALLVTGADQLLRRGDIITDNLAEGIAEVRRAEPGLASSLDSVDLPKLAASLASLSGALSEAAPALNALLRSELTDPRVIELISAGARAVMTGAEQARTEQTKLSGVFSLMRTLKDDDVARGLSFLVHVLREIGRDFSSEAPAS